LSPPEPRNAIPQSELPSDRLKNQQKTNKIDFKQQGSKGQEHKPTKNEDQEARYGAHNNIKWRAANRLAREGLKRDILSEKACEVKQAEH